MLTLGSLFDGIGGFPLVASWYGVTPVWASEIEAAPISITKRHFPGMLHLGDITKLRGGEIEPVDIITFGSPCQDLSVAGKQEGLDGERSGLFREAIRVIKEMREATDGEYPAFIVWENVPGARSSKKGEDFRVVLEEICKIKAPGASIPRSKRKWLVAGCIVDSDYSVAWRQFDAQYWGVPQRRKRVYLVADFRGGRASEILFKPKSMRRHTPACRPPWEAFADGIGAGAYLPRGATVIPINDCATRHEGYHSNGLGIGEAGAPSPAITAGDGHAIAIDCHNTPLVAYGFDLQQITSKENRSSLKEIQPTLCSGGKPHVVVAIDCRNLRETEISGTLQAKEAGYSLNYINPVRIGYQVRRLTPLECERLQGFPDGWTKYGHDGREISDTARYRALGNSVALPCVDYVMAGIVDAMEEA